MVRNLNMSPISPNETQPTPITNITKHWNQIDSLVQIFINLLVFRILPTIILQIFCKIISKSQDSVESTMNPDDTFKRNSQALIWLNVLKLCELSPIPCPDDRFCLQSLPLTARYCSPLYRFESWASEKVPSDLGVRRCFFAGSPVSSPTYN